MHHTSKEDKVQPISVARCAIFSTKFGYYLIWLAEKICVWWVAFFSHFSNISAENVAVSEQDQTRVCL